MSSCPECGKKHRSFPRKCFYAVHADQAHAVIANVASHGNPLQKEWAAETAKRWSAMKEYCAPWKDEFKE